MNVIPGYATEAATKNYLQKHRTIACNKIGTTKLSVSQAGFGCYRVSAGVSHHEQALGKALCQGVNLIDTSANYADGASETLVGQVLEKLIDAGELKRDEVVVVSKVGYLQGQNYALSRERKQQRRPFGDLVEYGEGLEHCIHPEFLRDQLNRSLERLNLETLDFYLLHNPEYYLEWAEKNRQPLNPARNEYYRRIKTAFEYLEEEVAQGRIRYYGISSNTFPAPADHSDFTCLATIWNLAEAMDSRHHFRFIQLPFNLMESGAVLEKNQPNGDSILEFAHQKKLGVMDFLEPHADRNADIANWMTSHREKIEDAFEAVASIYAEQATHRVDRMRRTLAAADRDWAKAGTLSQKALRAIRSTPGVTCTLVGMRREEYVADVLVELRRRVNQELRAESWQKLTEALIKES